MVFLLPAGIPRIAALLALAALFITYAFILARRLFRTYRLAVRAVDDFHSDDIAVYLRWMSIFTYWAIVFGVMVALLTFLPDKYVFLWIISAIPFYIYLFCSYMNYLLFCEQVETILDSEMDNTPQEDQAEDEENNAKAQHPTYYAEMGQKLAAWIGANGFTRTGLTIEQLADEMKTNRTYLYHYIRNIYGMSFREWVNYLRIGYAKELLGKRNDMSITEISEACGYISPAHFFSLFSKRENSTPARWRKQNHRE